VTEQEQLIESDKADILDWLAVQSKEVQKNAEVVSASDFPCGMIHIDKNTPKVFVPMMPPSASPTGENRTCARITVAPTIVGCCYGYARVEMDFLDGPNKKFPRDPYRGGYEISELDFKHAIKPNAKLTYDGDRSDEHWLVSYSKETLQTKPSKVGKLFITAAHFQAAKTGDTVQMPAAKLIGYLWHEKASGILFTKNNTLKPGYYRIEMLFEDPGVHTPEKESNHTAVPCSKAEYDDRKQLHAAMLSETSPVFAKWF
jgi:hypothetical protein